jgi:hypothetical protein
MASDTSEVFRFVAVRPVQLPTDEEATVAVIRDRRAVDADAKKQLAAFAQQLDSPAGARRRWQQLDLTSFAALAAGRRAIVEAYAALDPAAPPPTAATLVAAAGLGDVDPSDVATPDALWDALYVAHATGPEAGGLLDLPTAALRALHFLTLVAGDPKPARDLALRALSATPAIDVDVDRILRSHATNASAVAGAPAHPVEEQELDTTAAPAASGSKLARQLVDAAQATRAVLARIQDSGDAPPTITTDAPTSFGALSRSTLSVRTARTASSVLGGDLAPQEGAALDAAGVGTTTSVGEARALLQRRLSDLGTQALARAADPAFQQELTELILARQLTFPFPLTQPGPVPAPEDPGTAVDVDVHGRITPLGVGDLKVVKQKLLDYEPGEVAYIENVLARESKSRVYRQLHRTQTTLFESEEETRDTERDTQSTDRFELKRESNNTIKEDMSIKAGVQVTASYGPVVTHVSGDFAYSTSKEDSQKTASDYAHDVVDRSITKVQVKTVTQRTTVTTDETEETDTHGVDNTQSGDNVVGVYRWVDKRYRAQVYNYGVRLLLEFVVPEPAAFYRAAKNGLPVELDATAPVPFLNDLTPFLPPQFWRTLAASDVTADNYQQYAARYGAAGVTPPPDHQVYISASLSKDGMDNGVSAVVTTKDFVVPDGYTLTSHEVSASVLWVNYPKFAIQVGDQLYNIVDDESNGNSRLITRPAVGQGGVGGGAITPVNGPVAVTTAAYDVHGFAVTVQGVCTLDDAAFVAWQLKTYDKILAAYQALQAAYDEKLANAKQARADVAITGQNPAFNRQVESQELKKLCITMMTGQHFGQFHAVTAPGDAPTHHPEVDVLEALREGPIVQFLEQAFEWEQMTYLFYPYFWGAKQGWAKLAGVSDPDPLFQRFLTAGSCRVVVPVPIAYVDAVLYLLQSPATDLASKIWRGGKPPTLDSPLYVSLAQEFQNATDDLAGAVPEGDPWEFTLPTTLVWLQPDGTLPTYA